MIKFSKLFETVYEPRSGDEKNFKDKHVIMKIKTPYDTESQFTSDKPKAKRKADQEDDVAVYESLAGDGRAFGAAINRAEASRQRAIKRAARMVKRGFSPEKAAKEHDLRDSDIPHIKKHAGISEAAEVHTKRADKEPVIVQAIDPKTGQSRAKTVMRRAGEIKVEEVEQIDELSGDKLRDYYTKAGADRKKARVELKKGLSDLSLSSDDVKNGRGAKSFTSSSVQKTIDASQRFIKRGKGMALAAKKMSEEVEQIDELSDDKLRSYHAKAGADRMKAKTEVEKGMSAKSFTPASVQKTTDSYKRFIKRGKGMTLAANKMSEEVELEEGIDKMSNARLKFHAEKNFPHGSYTRKEIQDEHKRRMRVEPNYHTVKPSLSEESDLDEKVVNPYAVGMAAAMKATGDRPPLKKSTIIKGHEIAKSIKKEAMDPIGKEDDDIDNDGDVDKSDKYLKNRRKAIGRALQKEDASIDQENSSYTIYKKSNKPNPIKKNAEDAVKEEVEQIDELSKKTLGSYIKKSSEKVAAKSNHAGEIEGRGDSNITPAARSTLAKLNRKTVNGLVGISRATNRLTKEEVDLDEAVEVRHDRYMRSHGKKARDSGQGSGTWMFTHKSMGDVDYNNHKEVHTARGNFSDAKKSAQKWAKEHGHRSVYVMEEVDQLDELSPSTLHSYIKKAAPDIAARTMSAVASNQSAQTKKHASKLGNRISGVTSASGRLADKANADLYEEYSQIEEAFKVGAMKLHDGSAVTLTKESVDALNTLFNQLNGANKAKMEERMMSGKKGFQEILSFAENI